VDGKLVTLARRLIDLDREAADVRDEMRRLLANGGGPGPRPPTRRAVKPAKARPATPEASAARLSPNAARIAQARMAEQRILELLADGPKGPAQLARSTNAQIGGWVHHTGYALVIQPKQANPVRLKRAESAPTGFASGTAGIRAIAAVPLQREMGLMRRADIDRGFFWN
jgi:hypothetical protein